MRHDLSISVREVFQVLARVRLGVVAKHADSGRGARSMSKVFWIMCSRARSGDAQGRRDAVIPARTPTGEAVGQRARGLSSTLPLASHITQ